MEFCPCTVDMLPFDVCLVPPENLTILMTKLTGVDIDVDRVIWMRNMTKELWAFECRQWKCWRSSLR